MGMCLPMGLCLLPHLYHPPSSWFGSAVRQWGSPHAPNIPPAPVGRTASLLSNAPHHLEHHLCHGYPFCGQDKTQPPHPLVIT